MLSVPECAIAFAVGFGMAAVGATCDGRSLWPVDVLSRVDARTVARCSGLEREPAGVAACLDAAVMTPALWRLLDRATSAVERAAAMSDGGADATEASPWSRWRAGHELDAALDALSNAVARTHDRRRAACIRPPASTARCEGIAE